MNETTRMIAADQRRLNSPQRSQDALYFRADLTPGREGVAGPDPDAGQRFVSEIHFASFYARKLADTLAMQRLELAVVEDRDYQTGFTFSSVDERWHGFISTHRRPYDEVRRDLIQR